MKVFSISLLVSCLAAGAAAAEYALSWSTVASGGGTSTGGVFAVSGTLGQPDAGAPMTNGAYSVTGGFWALPIAVQSSNAPTLSIVPGLPGYAKLSWTPATPGFVLQESADQSAGSWSYAATGATNPVTVPCSMPVRFYRLIKP